MNRSIALLITAAALAVASLGLVACGGDDDDDGGGGDGGAAAATETGSAGTAGAISTESIDGREVLTDAQGRALYTAEEEANGRVLCTGECLTVWEPVVPGGGELDPALGLDMITRPDGGKQVTYDGRPLYRFLEEGPGELTGDGLVDSFEGQEFTWVAASEEQEPSAEEPESDTSDSPGGYGY